MLESILMKKSEKLRHKALKPVKRPQELTFAEYALKATENLPEEFQSNMEFSVFIYQSTLALISATIHISKIVRTFK